MIKVSLKCKDLGFFIKENKKSTYAKKSINHKKTETFLNCVLYVRKKNYLSLLYKVASIRLHMKLLLNIELISFLLLFPKKNFVPSEMQNFGTILNFTMNMSNSPPTPLPMNYLIWARMLYNMTRGPTT